MEPSYSALGGNNNEKLFRPIENLGEQTIISCMGPDSSSSSIFRCHSEWDGGCGCCTCNEIICEYMENIYIYMYMYHRVPWIFSLTMSATHTYYLPPMLHSPMKNSTHAANFATPAPAQASNLRMFLVQMGYMIPPTNSGSSPWSLPSWTFLEIVLREASRRPPV